MKAFKVWWHCLSKTVWSALAGTGEDHRHRIEHNFAYTVPKERGREPKMAVRKVHSCTCGYIPQ